MGSAITSLSRRLLSKKEMRILIVGLDAAGKTSILYKLKLGEIVTTIPTIGFNVETIEHRGVRLTSWDVGGRSGTRALVRHYFQNTQALVYVVDSNDRDRMEQVREELHRNVNEEELRDAALLVFANKQDLPNAMSKDEVVEKLGLHTIRNHRWAAFSSSATSGDGLYDGLDWLVSVLADTGVKKAVSEPVTQTVSDAKGLSGRVISPVSEWFKQLTSGWWSSPTDISPTTDES